MLPPNLAEFLRARRADCNARFAAARLRWPRLDADDFSRFLRNQLSPLASALDPGLNSRIPVILEAGYDLGLQLVGEKLAGPAAPNNGINSLWSELFPTIARPIAAAPKRIMGGLSNAVHQLESTVGTRPREWRIRLAELSGPCETPEDLLTLGQLLAWRAGLAHYRHSALMAADALPPELALDAVGAPRGADWPSVRDQHLDNPWFGYTAEGKPYPSDKLGHRIGAFRGFGGPFPVPPVVMESGAGIVVCSSDESWILAADVFGATLHRATPQEVERSKPSPTARIGRVPEECIAPSSIVIQGQTFAACSEQSHTVWVGPAIRVR